MNIVRGSEYVRQGSIEFQMNVSGVWAEPISLICEALLGVKDILLWIPQTLEVMTTNAVITAQLPNSLLYPKNPVSFAINVQDGSINANFIPGKLDITTTGAITITPNGVASFSGANGGGFSDLSLPYIGTSF